MSAAYVQPDGWTPLHISAAKGFAEIASVLIAHDAALDVPTVR